MCRKTRQVCHILFRSASYPLQAKRGRRWGLVWRSPLDPRSPILDTKGGEFPIPKILTLPSPPNTLTHTQAESGLSKVGSQDTAEKSIKEEDEAASLEFLC